MDRYRKRVDSLLRELRFNRLLIDTYAGEGWTDSMSAAAGSATRRVTPTAHVAEAERKVLHIKAKLARSGQTGPKGDRGKSGNFET